VKETAVNKLPYPEDGDIPNGPAQIKALADALEAIKWPTANVADKAITEAKLADALKSLLVHDTAESLKIIRGIVDTSGAGSIVEGAGFTIKRKAAGDIEILFTDDFSDVPSVTVAVLGGTMRVVRVNEATAAATRLIVQTTGLIAVDNVLSFIAVGPR
jgi:hypothetical protein